MSRITLPALFAFALLSGCGGSDTETTPDYQYPTQADYCTGLADHECNDNVVQACYGSDQSTLADDTKSCVAARVAQCNANKLPYHPDAAVACVDSRKQGLEDAVWTHAELDAAAAACAPVFSKAGPEGAVCTSDDDCDTGGGLHCVIKLAAVQGVCATPKQVAGGEDCKDPASVCGDAFYCDPKVSHCIAKPVEGEACSESAPCASDFYCTGPDTGMCAAKTKNGLKCDSDVVCAGGFCLGAMGMMQGICSSTLPLQITSSTCDLYRQ